MIFDSTTLFSKIKQGKAFPLSILFYELDSSMYYCYLAIEEKDGTLSFHYIYLFIYFLRPKPSFEGNYSKDT